MIKPYKKTKIICTVGPACNNETSIKQLIKAGVNTFRLNFSHGTLESHAEFIRIIRKTA